jgi:predicted O-methyltransferase YrrM
MRAFKAKLKQGLASLPPFRDWFADFDLLRQRCNKLQWDYEAATVETEALRLQLQTTSDELTRAKAAQPGIFASSEPLWISPGHFYSPIPANPVLRASEEEIFSVPPAIRGVDLNEERQLELLKVFSSLYREHPFAPDNFPQRYVFENPNYSYGDAIVLYCMIRHLSPRRIVEVGSGYSSCAMLDVNELFFADSIACTFIDPYPELLRRLLKRSDLTRTRILGQTVQDVELGVFRELQASDILFIDSSHVTKTGSDVNYIFFKILPILNEGVYVHFHDVFYPFEYPRGWVFEGRAWNEAYMLRAFLQYNRAFRIQFFATYLLHKHRDLIESELPLCLKNPGANIWLQKVLHDPELDRTVAIQERVPRPAPKRIDPFQPAFAPWLRDGWYRPEADHCWMGQFASVQLGGPETANERLKVRAHSPHERGVTLSAIVEAVELGSVPVPAASTVEAEFALPANFIGRSQVSVLLCVDPAHRIEGDFRTLGLSIHRIEIA